MFCPQLVLEDSRVNRLQEHKLAPTKGRISAGKATGGLVAGDFLLHDQPSRDSVDILGNA